MNVAFWLRLHDRYKIFAITSTFRGMDYIYLSFDNTFWEISPSWNENWKWNEFPFSFTSTVQSIAMCVFVMCSLHIATCNVCKDKSVKTRPYSTKDENRTDLKHLPDWPLHRPAERSDAPWMSRWTMGRTHRTLAVCDELAPLPWSHPPLIGQRSKR